MNHIWRYDGGPPWAIAPDHAEAVRLMREDFDFTDDSRITQVPDDESFTMIFDDLPPLLEGRSDCECNAATLEEMGCDCGGGNQVTMDAGELANHRGMLRMDLVFREYGT